MAANPFDDSNTERTVADELTITQSERFNRLTAALDKQRLALQNSEATFITRLADIDDEQRRAVSQINKQHATLYDRLKTTRILTLSLIAGVIISVTVISGVFYMQTQQRHHALMAEIAELRDMTNTLQRQIPDNAVQNKVIQERLTQLSLRVTGLTRAAVTPTVTSSSLNDSELSPNSSPPKLEEPAADTASATIGADTAVETKPALFHSESNLDSTPPAATTVNAPPSTTNSAEVEKVAVTDTLYSLQLIGFFSFAELINYVQKVPLPPRVYYQTETFRGRPWFVLIHSLHTSYASAKATIAQFPPALAELDVWIRKLPLDATVTALNIQPVPAQP